MTCAAVATTATIFGVVHDISASGSHAVYRARALSISIASSRAGRERYEIPRIFRGIGLFRPHTLKLTHAIIGHGCEDLHQECSCKGLGSIGARPVGRAGDMST